MRAVETRTRIERARRALLLGAALLALPVSIGACGGDGGEGERATTIPTVETNRRTTPAAPAARERPRKARRPRSGARPAPGGRRELFARLPANRRREFARQVTRVMLRVLGARNARIDVGAGGRVVTVGVSAGEACRLSPRAASRLAERVRAGAPFVSSVQVRVTGSDASLSDYIRSRCRRAEMPRVDAPVVLTRSGASFALTQPFRIRARRWTIAYENDGDQLSIVPYRGERPMRGAIARNGAVAGKVVLPGPGVFRLRVAGLIGWRVRVYDGA